MRGKLRLLLDHNNMKNWDPIACKFKPGGTLISKWTEWSRGLFLSASLLTTSTGVEHIG